MLSDKLFNSQMHLFGGTRGKIKDIFVNMDLEKFFDSTDSTLSEAIKISTKALESISGRPLRFPVQDPVFNDFAIRAHYCLSSTHLLWNSFRVNPFYKFPISIQLRVGVLDYLTFIYLWQFCEDATTFKSEFDRLNQSFYKWLQGKTQTIREQDKDKYDKFFESHFPEKFETDGTGKHVDDLTVRKMTLNSEKSDFAEDVEEAYTLYRLLSQYEHYSDVSRKFLKRPNGFDLLQIHQSIIFVMILQDYCFKYLGVPDECWLRYRELAKNYHDTHTDEMMELSKQLSQS